MQIDYTATRSIKSGHSVDTAYTITIGVAKFDRTPVFAGVEHRSLSGSTVTVTHRNDIVYTIVTQRVETTTTPDRDDMREFLDSVKNGEEFDIDSVTCVLDSAKAPYTETREAPDHYSYTFKARVV